MIKTLPYQDLLISYLKEKNHAAGYIDAVFEEKDPEPELLKLVLSNVAEALSEKHFTPEEAKIHREKLDEILSQQGNEAIYNLAMWLNTIGLKLTVTVLEQAENNINHTANNAEIHV